MTNFKHLNLLIKIAISVSILVLLMMRMDDHVMSDLAAAFKASAWLYAFIFMLAQLVLLSLRWKLLLNVGQKHLTFAEALQINLTSQLANLVFITSVGGILARIALSVQHGASIFKTLIATVIDRVMTLSALLLLSALFLPGLSEYVNSRMFTTLSGYISVFIVTLFIFTPLFLNFIVFRLPQAAKLKGRLRYGMRYLKILINSPVLCGKTILISLIAQLAFFVSVFSLTSYGITDLTFMQLMTVLPMISLIAALPISIGGWGVREGAFVYGLGLLGVPMESAFLISVQVGLIGMLVTVLAGLPSMLTSDLHVDRLATLKQRFARIRI